MNKVKQFLAKNWHLLFWPVVATLIFIPTFGKYTVLPSPDSAPYYSESYRLSRFQDILLNSSSISIGDIFQFMVPILFWHDFHYWLMTVLIALGFYWFMRERDVPKIPAIFAGGALAFSGYAFTLISAGHRSYFSMGPYVVLTFAFLVHAVRRESKLAYALAAASAAWTFRHGPDIGPQFLVVAAIYAIWLFAANVVKKPIAERRKPFILGCIIALVSFAIVAAPSIYETCTSTLKWRQQQIEQSSGTALTASADNNGESAVTTSDDKTKKAQEQWIFATNWSLPPEETIEFIAPSIFGTWSGDRNCPYWGRLGRSEGWDPAHPQRGGFFNFRQHIIYLGALPVAFLIFACIAFFTRKAKKDTDNLTATSTPLYISDVPFWLTIGIVALLLAFGRYAPFYRAFYSIPYMSYLRAPVKFMRLVEFATYALAASGQAALLAETCNEKIRRIFGYSMLAASAACVIYAMQINGSVQTFAAVLGKLGANQLMRPMTIHAVHSLWHPILGFALIAAISFALMRKRIRTQIAAGIFLIALAVDIGIVTKPFMFTADYSLYYKPNAVTETVLQEVKRPDFPNVTVLGVQQLPDWFKQSLSFSGIRRQPFEDMDHNEFLQRTQGDIAAMCDLTGSTHMIIPATLSRSVDRTKFEHIAFLNLNANGIARIQTPTKNSLEFLRVKKHLPYFRLYSKWQYASDDDWMKKTTGLTDNSTLIIGKDISCASNSVSATASAEMKSFRYKEGRFFTVIDIDTPSDSVLLALDRVKSNLTMWIDGKPAELFPAGYAHFMGALVPAGKHTVKIGKPIRVAVPLYSLSVLLLVLFGACRFLSKS